MPIDPPYKEAVLLKRQNKLAKPQVQVSHLASSQTSGELSAGAQCTTDSDSKQQDLTEYIKLRDLQLSE